jgi:hypothetical protein
MARKEIVSAFDGDEPMEYEIRLRGHLEEHWSDWLGGLTISHDAEGYSLLTGAVPDQAALHGILAQIRDLGLILISIVSQTGSDQVQEF